jgi:site-specific DNA recombinase
MPRRSHRLRIEAARAPVDYVKKVAVYLRVSTDEQARSGLGLDDQMRRCQAMAAAKGWPTPAIYADEGLSGTLPAEKRPALKRLLEDVAAGQVQAVIILELSRLARKTRLVLDLVDRLAASGAWLVSCKETLDTTTPQGAFVLTMFASLAQLERDVIAQRTSAALAAHSLRDGESGGRLPYGYVRTADGPRVDAKAAKEVRRIYAWRTAGNTLQWIADKLNSAGVAPPQRGEWWPSSVREVMENETAYRGGLRGASQLRWPVILKG